VSVETTALAGSSNPLRRMLGVFRPAAAAPRITDRAEVRRGFAYFRPRILIWTTIGYGTFYLVRQNIPVAMPVMTAHLGYTKAQLGAVVTVQGVAYGVSKFLNGMVGDRADGRIFMTFGLAAAAIANICFGFSSALIVLCVLWGINGWFQGMGYPPCARLLTHWFAPKELATKMAIWNASHNLGSVAILLLTGYLVGHSYSWRLCFIVPAILALLVCPALLKWLRDTPESVGLPPVETLAKTNNEEITEEITQSPGEFRIFIWRQVFSNQYIWIVSIANFFVYTLRYGVFVWGPTMLLEFKHIKLSHGAVMVCIFEVAGLAGAIVTGRMTDRLFGGRGAPICMICMLLAGVTVFALWRISGDGFVANTALLAAAGFFVYSPQALVAVIAAKLATKRAAATAVGLTSIFGYGSTLLSGVGIGWLVQNYGWGAAFSGLIGIAMIGALLFLMALPAVADGEAYLQSRAARG
jgi:sugar phosphate permease